MDKIRNGPKWSKSELIQIRNRQNQKWTKRLKSEMARFGNGPNHKWTKSEMDQNGANQN